jgi:putative sigma-54 modulation protein
VRCGIAAPLVSGQMRCAAPSLATATGLAIACRGSILAVKRHDSMKLILSTHNLTLTKAIEDHVVAKLQKLDHLDPRAIDARVTLEHDHSRAPEKQFACSIRLSVRGPDLFAEDRQNDLYAAIDRVVKKIEQQLRKRHKKQIERWHKQAARDKERAKTRAR